MKNMLITIEGSEGSGKTIFANMIERGLTDFSCVKSSVFRVIFENKNKLVLSIEWDKQDESKSTSTS